MNKQIVKKPSRLRAGDTIAIVSPSWGGPSIFPHVYENGLKILTDWGLVVKEFPSARADAEFLKQHPQARANDINAAFSDPDVKAIIASIGGDDSVRILPFMDEEIIVNNPKILMGFSDTTTLHVYCAQRNLVTFHGPSIMAGFSQMRSLPCEYEHHVREMFFEPQERYEYKPYSLYCEGYPEWADFNNLGKTYPLKASQGWRWAFGSHVVQGKLFGGCLEVLEMLKGTELWPSDNFWSDKILFLETSELCPSLEWVAGALRDYGMRGILSKISGLIIARPFGYSDERITELEDLVIAVVTQDFERSDLPIIVNADAGHTDPKIVLPLGIRAEIDCRRQTLSLIEPWLR